MILMFNQFIIIYRYLDILIAQTVRKIIFKMIVPSTNPEINEQIRQQEAVKDPLPVEKLCNYKRWLLVSFLMVVLIAASASLAIYMLSTQPTTQIIYLQITELSDNSKMVVAGIKTSDSKQSSSFRMFATIPIQDTNGRRLEESQASIIVHTQNIQNGITLSMTPQGNATVYVNTPKFISYIEKQLETDNQITNQTLKQASQDNTTNYNDKQFYVQLGNIFTQALDQTGNKDIKVEFQTQTMINLKISPNDHTLQYDLDSQTTNRTLTQVSPHRVLFANNLISRAANIVSDSMKQVVQLTRKNGPQIGRVVGGVVGATAGFAVGGFPGAYQGAIKGMRVGQSIGTAASALVQSCVPQGTLKVSCSAKSIGQVAGQYGTGYALGKLFPQLPAGTPAAFNQYFKNGNGAIIGNYIQTIPSQAISKIGIGKIKRR